MTSFSNTAEGGTDGGAVSVANSGGASGDAWSVVAASAAQTYRAADAFHGNLCYQYYQPDTAQACYSAWNDTASDKCAVSIYFRLIEYPSANCQAPINARGAAAVARLNLSTTGQLAIAVVNGASNYGGVYSTATLSLNTWYRIEFTGSGFGTSSTEIKCNVYLGDNTGTPSFAVPSVSGVTTAEQITVVRYGRNSTGATNFWLIDDPRQVFGTSAELGPSPTGSAGTDQTVEPGQPVQLTPSGSGTWAQTAGTTVQQYDNQGITTPAANLAAWSALWDTLPITGPGTGTGGWMGGDGCWSVTHPTGQSALFTFGDSPVTQILPVVQLGTSSPGQGTATDRLIVVASESWKFSPGGKVQVFQSDGTTPRYGASVTHKIASMNTALGYTNLNLTTALPSAPAVGDVIKGVTGGTDQAIPNSSAVLWTRRRGLQLVTGLGTFIPNDAGQATTWYWSGPMVVDSDGALYCFPSKQQFNDSPAGYGLIARGLFRYTWDLPWACPSSPQKITDITSPILWGAAVCNDNTYNYVYGAYKPSSNDYSFNLYLARVPRGKLSNDPDTWDFWTPAGWASSPGMLSDPTQLATLISYGADTFQGVENTISAHNLGGFFKVTSKKGGVFGSALTVWDAPAPEGPYTPRTVGSAPYGSPTSNDQTYLANGHFNLPPLGTGNYLVSVSKNRVGLTAGDYLAGSPYYRPTWFEVAANGGTYTPAPAGSPSNLRFMSPHNSTVQQVLTFTFGSTTVNVTVLAPTERIIRNGVEVPYITRTAL